MKSSRSNSVVVTGGAGFVGHHLVKKLTNNNCKVHIIDNLSNSNKHFLDECRVNPQLADNVIIHNEDIENRSAISEIFKLERIDTCIHLAAKISVEDSMIKPSKTIDVNVKGTLNILEACSKHGVQNFVFASSAAVYGHASKLPVSEETVPYPISPYGASKVSGEALVSAYRSKMKNCVSLRFFNIYGEGQTFEYAGVITRFMARLLKELPPVIYGNGFQTRDFISVNDVVNSIILAAELNYEPQGVSASCAERLNIFNIGSGKQIRIIDLAQMMIEIFGFDSTIHPTSRAPLNGDILHIYADIQKANDVLKFSVTEDLRTALVDMFKSSFSRKRDPLLFHEQARHRHTNST